MKREQFLTKVMKIQSEMQSRLKILGESVPLSWGVGSSGDVSAPPCVKQDGWECELVESRGAWLLSEVVSALLPAHHTLLR